MADVETNFSQDQFQSIIESYLESGVMHTTLFGMISDMRHTSEQRAMAKWLSTTVFRILDWQKHQPQANLVPAASSNGSKE